MISNLDSFRVPPNFSEFHIYLIGYLICLLRSIGYCSYLYIFEPLLIHRVLAR